MKLIAAVEGVKAAYGDLVVLHGIDLEVRSEEVVAIIGHNGAGKSTLLKSFVAMVDVVAGTRRIHGNEHRRARFSRFAAAGSCLLPARQQSVLGTNGLGESSGKRAGDEESQVGGGRGT